MYAGVSVNLRTIEICAFGRNHKKGHMEVRRDVSGAGSRASLFGYSSLESQVFSNRSPMGQPKRSLSLSRFSKRMDLVWFVTMRLKFW